MIYSAWGQARFIGLSFQLFLSLANLSKPWTSLWCWEQSCTESVKVVQVLCLWGNDAPFLTNWSDSLEGWLSWLKRWSSGTFVDEWSPPSVMSASAMPFILSLFFSCNNHVSSFQCLTHFHFKDTNFILFYFCCWRWQSPPPLICHTGCKIISKVKLIFSFDNLQCTDVYTVLL